MTALTRRQFLGVLATSVGGAATVSGYGIAGAPDPTAEKPQRGEDSAGRGLYAYSENDPDARSLADSLLADGYREVLVRSNSGTLFGQTQDGDWVGATTAVATFVHADGREAVVTFVTSSDDQRMQRPAEAHVWTPVGDTWELDVLTATAGPAKAAL